jgi:hypothetical protein
MNMPSTKLPSIIEPQVSVGDIVCVYALDWAILSEQTVRNINWDVVRGKVYGELIAITEDGLVVASQVFDDGGVRSTLVIPKVCIKSVTVLEAE